MFRHAGVGERGSFHFISSLRSPCVRDPPTWVETTRTFVSSVRKLSFSTSMSSRLAGAATSIYTEGRWLAPVPFQGPAACSVRCTRGHTASVVVLFITGRWDPSPPERKPRRAGGRAKIKNCPRRFFRAEIVFRKKRSICHRIYKTREQIKKSRTVNSCGPTRVQIVQVLSQSTVGIHVNPLETSLLIFFSTLFCGSDRARDNLQIVAHHAYHNARPGPYGLGPWR